MARDIDIAKILAAFFSALDRRFPGTLQEIEENLQHVDARLLGQTLWLLRQSPGSRPEREKTKEWCLREAKLELGEKIDPLSFS